LDLVIVATWAAIELPELSARRTREISFDGSRRRDDVAPMSATHRPDQRYAETVVWSPKISQRTDEADASQSPFS